jgi:glycerophosphoryl diester phosphodiesterase
MAAFDLGLAAGADGLEIDVHLSSDGVAIVCHDATLDRTTDASGPVAARTAAELSRVDAGFRFGSNGDHPFRGRGVGIPALRDVLRRYPDTPVIVEMKVDRPEMGLALAAEVLGASAMDRVCAASSGCRALRTVREVLPGLATSACRWDVRLALYRSWVGWPVRQAAYRGFQVPEVAGATRIVSRDFIRHAHEGGFEVHVWTVDEEADMERLLAWGADGLITNRPDAAVAVRNRFAAGSRQAAAGGRPGSVERGLQPARRQ